MFVVLVIRSRCGGGSRQPGTLGDNCAGVASTVVSPLVLLTKGADCLFHILLLIMRL